LANLAACGLDPANLTLEITEHSFASNVTPVQDAVAQLTEAGIAIAIDDFGTGYSTLRYLQRLGPKVLKIDRSFVAELATDAAARKLISAVHTMAQTLGLRVVAEGIETIDQLAFLRSIGCALGQGCVFSPPVPASALPALLERSHEHRRVRALR
jgi:EAL domain-containing protein (putative c-di-GMP-specific phosphodiesterase class I)